MCACRSIHVIIVHGGWIQIWRMMLLGIDLFKGDTTLLFPVDFFHCDMGDLGDMATTLPGTRKAGGGLLDVRGNTASATVISTADLFGWRVRVGVVDRLDCDHNNDSVHLGRSRSDGDEVLKDRCRTSPTL